MCLLDKKDKDPHCECKSFKSIPLHAYKGYIGVVHKVYDVKDWNWEHIFVAECGKQDVRD